MPQPLSADSQDNQQQWQSFRERRDSSLAVDHGWLTLTSLQWLSSEPALLNLVPGLWHASAPGEGRGATLTAQASDGATLVSTGEQVDGTVSESLADGGSRNWVRYEDTMVELAVRGNRYVVRTRDNRADTLTGFTGVPVYPYTSEALTEGTYTPYPEPRALPIRTAHPEVDDVVHATGTVTFSLGGVQHTLVARQSPDGSLTVGFHDGTNGTSTAPWRFLVTGEVSPTGAVLLDFNRSLNYPSAFTPYGTCPMPVDGNRISVPVEAGEQIPAWPTRPVWPTQPSRRADPRLAHSSRLAHPAEPSPSIPSIRIAT